MPNYNAFFTCLRASTEFATTTKEDTQKYILSKCKQLVSGFDIKETFHSFCGSRAKVRDYLM